MLGPSTWAISSRPSASCSAVSTESARRFRRSGLSLTNDRDGAADPNRSPSPQLGGQLGQVAAAGGDEQVAGEVGEGAGAQVQDQR